MYFAACSTMQLQGPLKPFVSHPIARQDWNAFFQAIESPRVSYLMACVAEIYFGMTRKGVLTLLWRASRRQGSRVDSSEITLKRLTAILRFDDREQTREFCQNYGFTFTKLVNTDDELLNLNSAQGRALPEPKKPVAGQTFSNVVERKRVGRTFPAVINGLSYARAKQGGLVEESNGSQDISMDASQDDQQSLFVPQDKSSTLAVVMSTQSSDTLLDAAPKSISPFSANVAQPERKSSPFASFGATSAAKSNPFAPTSIGPKSAFTPSIPAFSPSASPPAVKSPFSSFGVATAAPVAQPDSAKSSEKSPLGDSIFARPAAKAPLFSWGKPTAPAASNYDTSQKDTSIMPAFSATAASAATVAAFGTPAAAPSQASVFGSIHAAPSNPFAAVSSTASPEPAPTSISNLPLFTNTTNVTETASSPLTTPAANQPDKIDFSSGPAQVAAGSNPLSSLFTLPKKVETPPPSAPSAAQHATQAAPQAFPSFSFAKPEATTKDVPLARDTTTVDASAVKTFATAPFASISKQASQPKASSPLSQVSTLTTATQPDPKPKRKKISPEVVLTRLAREVLCDPERGLLQQFIEYHTRSVIVSVYDDLYNQNLRDMADTFRRERLAIRYGKRWRQTCWSLALLRQGRDKREKRRAAQREKEKRQKQAHDREEAKAHAVDDFLASQASHNALEDVSAASVMSHVSDASQQSTRLSARARDRLPQSTTNGHPMQASFMHSTRSGRISKHNDSLVQPSGLRSSISSNTSERRIAKPPASRSTYFRMKAMGLLSKSGSVVPMNARKRAREDDSTGGLSPAYKRSRTPPRVATSSRNDDVSATSRSSPLVLSSPRAASVTSSRAMSKAEEEDEALFARARAVRRDLAQTSDFYTSEIQKASVNENRRQRSESLHVPVSAPEHRERVPAYRLRESRFVPREAYGKAIDRARQVIIERKVSTSAASHADTPGISEDRYAPGGLITGLPDDRTHSSRDASVPEIMVPAPRSTPRKEYGTAMESIQPQSDPFVEEVDQSIHQSPSLDKDHTIQHYIQEQVLSLAFSPARIVTPIHFGFGAPVDAAESALLVDASAKEAMSDTPDDEAAAEAMSIVSAGLYADDTLLPSDTIQPQPTHHHDGLFAPAEAIQALDSLSSASAMANVGQAQLSAALPETGLSGVMSTSTIELDNGRAGVENESQAPIDPALLDNGQYGAIRHGPPRQIASNNPFALLASPTASNVTVSEADVSEEDEATPQATEHATRHLSIDENGDATRRADDNAQANMQADDAPSSDDGSERSGSTDDSEESARSDEETFINNAELQDGRRVHASIDATQAGRYDEIISQNAEEEDEEDVVEGTEYEESRSSIEYDEDEVEDVHDGQQRSRYDQGSINDDEHDDDEESDEVDEDEDDEEDDESEADDDRRMIYPHYGSQIQQVDAQALQDSGQVKTGTGTEEDAFELSD